MPKAPRNDVSKGLYLNQVGSLSADPLSSEIEGGSFKSFFRKVGKVAKDVAHSAVDVGKQGVQFAVNHPELTAQALEHVGGATHEHYFHKELDKHMKKHLASGGNLSGGSFLSLAKKAFKTSKNLATKELKKQYSKAEPHIHNAVNDLKSKASTFAQQKLDELKDHGTKFASQKIDELKNKIHGALGSPSEEMVAGKRRLSPKMQKRNALVKQIMHKHGCSMIQASQYIKQHHLL